MIRASRGVRVTVALAALAGLLGATAFGAATTLHVLFEHQFPHGASAHEHGHAHAHPHEQPAADTGHTHTDAGQIHPGQDPGHAHPPLLAAESQSRSGRSSAGVASTGPAEDAGGLSGPAGRPPVRPAARASPRARAAPRACGSVVLQV